MMSEFLSIVFHYSTIILPWFIVGIAISYVASKYINHKSIKRFSGSLNLKKIVLSQILGMISPLSIMSFLPVANELTSWGVNPGLLLSFFIAERAYDLQSFFIISGLIGIKFALFNALAIFISLVVAAISIRKDKVNFVFKGNKKTNHFWNRQIKLLVIVILGICIGALIRLLLPEQLVSNLSGGYINGFISAVVLGFSIYLGPIVGNYPVAKAFSELGMSPIGIFAFLTISPIFNFVVIFLFGAAVGFKKAIKPILIYVATAIVLTFLFSGLI